MSKKEYQHRTITEKTDNIRQQLNNNCCLMLSVFSTVVQCRFVSIIIIFVSTVGRP